MNELLAIEYQRQLIYAVLDDFTPNNSLSEYYGGQYGANFHIWKQSVINFIFTNISCGLIDILNKKENYGLNTAESIRQHLTLINSEKTPNADIIWDTIYFYGTEKLENLIKAHELYEWECLSFNLKNKFICHLNDIYIENGFNNFFK
ncbi:hypothetical protein HZU77_015325 [Neisseriaceae bacterium TC5R-5]|nr:hypothetical protein [Neisseriaceae bacterium TC5R-5]